MQDYLSRVIDINQKMEDVTVKQFDGNSRALHVQILNQSLGKNFPMLIEGCAALMYIDTGNSHSVLIAGEIADGDNGIVVFIIPPAATQTAGDFPCEIRLTDASDDSVISTKIFTLHVEESIFDLDVTNVTETEGEIRND